MRTSSRTDVYIAFLGSCFRFYVNNGTVIKEKVTELASNHEEADTRICTHVKAIDRMNIGSQNIVIRASDTDIAVIMIYHCRRFAANVWMDVGTSSRNDRRYVNITAISSALGEHLSDALPGFHAFTGSDYTSAFVRKGKIRPFAILEKDKPSQKAFAQMSTEELDDVSVETLKHFTARMYGATATSKASLNQHRYKVFEKGYAPKASAKNPLEKLKGIAASTIPPCEAEVIEKIHRASFVAKMWANADQKEIDQHPAVSDGWKLDDNGSYEIIWFEGSQLPAALIPDRDVDEENENDESDTDMEMSSSDEDDILSSDEESDSDTDD